MATLTPITQLYRACDPMQAINPNDSRWVDLDAVRGNDSVVSMCVRGLRRSDPEGSDFKLFTGHRGVGKTSELQRLKQELERSGEEQLPFLVVFCDVNDGLDVNDLDFPDLLVFIAGQLQQQLSEMRLPGFSVTNSYFQRVWEDIKSVLGKEISISGAGTELPFGSLAIELRNRPNAREGLRKAIERNQSTLLSGVNDLLAHARVAAISNRRSGLVLIVDGLDKLVRRALADNSNTHERLFVDRAEQLASLKVHTIYTVPISLIYSPRFGQLEQTIGECSTVPVGMIKLRDNRTDPPRDDSPGMEVLRKILKLRCEFANMNLEDAFDDADAITHLCRISGGHPRHLMMLVQSACNETDALPLTKAHIDSAMRKYANSLLREIPDEAWAHIPNFANPQRDIPKDDLHQQMLFLLYIFEYMNGSPWYEVNPALRTVERFNSP